MNSPGTEYGKIRVGSTELSSFQRYRENTEKKELTFHLRGPILGPNGTQLVPGIPEI